MTKKSKDTTPLNEMDDFDLSFKRGEHERVIHFMTGGWILLLVLAGITIPLPFKVGNSAWFLEAGLLAGSVALMIWVSFYHRKVTRIDNVSFEKSKVHTEFLKKAMNDAEPKNTPKTPKTPQPPQKPKAKV